MKLQRTIILTLIFLITSGFQSKPTTSQEPISNDSVRKYVYQGFEHLYNFEFVSCYKKISYLKQHYPESPWTYILATNYYWWQYLTGENEDKTISYFYSNIYLAESHLTDNISYENLFCKTLIFAFKSRFDLMEERYIPAMKEFLKYTHVMRKSFGKEKEFKSFYLSSGLYNYLSAVAYRDYLFLRPLLFLAPSGNMNTGLSFLKRKKYDLILDTESTYFLLKIYFEIEKDFIKAEKYGKFLIKKYPKNFIFHHFYNKSYVKNHNSKLNNSQIENLKSIIIDNKELSYNQKKYLFSLIKKNY
ncbi:MAG: hypothetical protein U9R42_10100 [Bacteroidota bacterium]|nr:hypothetical protein [Bacteroidota bacterium]